MKSSHKVFSGLDIQKEYLTIAQYAPDEHSVMLVAIQPISNPSETSSLESASEELRTLKSKFKFANTNVNCSIPGEYAIVKKAPVDHGENDITGALKWELEQQIIGEVDEYIFDFDKFGTGTDGLEEYLVVAYRRDKINELATLLKRNKLSLSIVDLDVFAMINVYEANYDDYLQQPVLLVHAENEKAKLILTHQGKYIDFECFDYDYGPDPQAFAGRLKDEAQRLCLLSAFPNGAVGVPIFSAGTLFTQEDFGPSVASYVGEVSLLDPFRKISCRVGVDNVQLSTYLPQLSVAVGLALRGNE